MLKATKGAGTPEKLFGGTGADGKGSQRQTMLPGAKTTLTPGDPINRMMGNYGKNAPPGMPLLPPTASPSTHPAMNEVRGGSGGIKTHPKFGGLGSGTMGAIGSATPDATDPDQT